jgi:hypothetical protein
LHRKVELVTGASTGTYLERRKEMSEEESEGAKAEASFHKGVYAYEANRRGSTVAAAMPPAYSVPALAASADRGTKAAVMAPALVTRGVMGTSKKRAESRGRRYLSSMPGRREVMGYTVMVEYVIHRPAALTSRNAKRRPCAVSAPSPSSPPAAASVSDKPAAVPEPRASAASTSKSLV